MENVRISEEMTSVGREDSLGKAIWYYVVIALVIQEKIEGPAICWGRQALLFL